jgi:hypothetical protein
LPLSRSRAQSKAKAASNFGFRYGEPARRRNGGGDVGGRRPGWRKHGGRGDRTGAAQAAAPGKVSNLRPVRLTSTEDIAIDHQSGRAYVSSQGYQTKAAPEPQEAICGLHLEQHDPQPVNLILPLVDLAAGPRRTRRFGGHRPRPNTKQERRSETWFEPSL